MPLKIAAPAAKAVFQIGVAADWPSMLFKTDGSGEHKWKWTIVWRTFNKSGTATTAGNEWDAKAAVTNLGGALTVEATASAGNASVAVSITGTNPLAADVTAYVGLNPNGVGFDKILSHETKMKHFGPTGEPIKSFDNGYGMAQLTTPTPTFEQVWNWKLNVDGGIKLFQQKVSAAKTYLSQSGRTYTQGQLKFEAVCRWNGGSYHTWDATAKAWARNPAMLCDTKTGNIGWDMTDDKNKGKTEADLRKRDQSGYSSPPKADDHWKYSGVCYADAVLA